MRSKIWTATKETFITIYMSKFVSKKEKSHVRLEGRTLQNWHYVMLLLEGKNRQSFWITEKPTLKYIFLDCQNVDGWLPRILPCGVKSSVMSQFKYIFCWFLMVVKPIYLWQWLKRQQKRMPSSQNSHHKKWAFSSN